MREDTEAALTEPEEKWNKENWKNKIKKCCRLRELDNREENEAR